MKTKVFEEFVAEGNSRRITILTKKGQDYSRLDEDRLSNFKDVADIANILKIDGHQNHTPYGIASIMLLWKEVREANLRNSKAEPRNESRRDTLDDAHNYLDLRYSCAVDEQSQTPAK